MEIIRRMTNAGKNYKTLAKKNKKFFEKLHRGFECGPGWYKIIEKLTHDLQTVAEEKKIEVAVTDIKEKFGSLRFCLSTTSDEMEKLIEKAKDESEITCEICGDPGYMIKKYWLKVRCQQCKDI